jgi:hypothetical protein
MMPQVECRSTALRRESPRSPLAEELLDGHRLEVVIALVLGRDDRRAATAHRSDTPKQFRTATASEELRKNRLQHQDAWLAKSGDKAVTFAAKPPAGRTKLQTWFLDADGKEIAGAYSVTVRASERPARYPPAG